MQRGGSSHWYPWGRGLGSGSGGGGRGFSFVENEGKGEGSGEGWGGGVGTGKGTGKSMRKLCRSYPLATYPLNSAREISIWSFQLPQIGFNAWVSLAW